MIWSVKKSEQIPQINSKVRKFLIGDLKLAQSPHSLSNLLQLKSRITIRFQIKPQIRWMREMFSKVLGEMLKSWTMALPLLSSTKTFLLSLNLLGLHRHIPDRVESLVSNNSLNLWKSKRKSLSWAQIQTREPMAALPSWKESSNKWTIWIQLLLVLAEIKSTDQKHLRWYKEGCLEMAPKTL